MFPLLMSHQQTTLSYFSQQALRRSFTYIKKSTSQKLTSQGRRNWNWVLPKLPKLWKRITVEFSNTISRHQKLDLASLNSGSFPTKPRSLQCHMPFLSERIYDCLLICPLLHVLLCLVFRQGCQLCSF